MTCKDCIHYDVCQALEDSGQASKIHPVYCGCFKDKSRFIELPCKVGDTVYIIDDTSEDTEPYILDVFVTCAGYDISGFWITMSLPLGMKMNSYVGEGSLGKTVFLTKAEAEVKLKELEK